jgi:chaperonin GroEL (HSP60 family)
MEKPLVLVIAGNINGTNDIIKPLEFIKEIKRPLIVYSQKINKEALSMLIYNKVKGGVNVSNVILK